MIHNSKRLWVFVAVMAAIIFAGSQSPMLADQTQSHATHFLSYKGSVFTAVREWVLRLSSP
jgi:hypothetical protein